jgi:hypothetical protein
MCRLYRNDNFNFKPIRLTIILMSLEGFSYSRDSTYGLMVDAIMHTFGGQYSGIRIILIGSSLKLFVTPEMKAFN